MMGMGKIVNVSFSSEGIKIRKVKQKLPYNVQMQSTTSMCT